MDRLELMNLCLPIELNRQILPGSRHTLPEQHLLYGEIYYDCKNSKKYSPKVGVITEGDFLSKQYHRSFLVIFIIISAPSCWINYEIYRNI